MGKLASYFSPRIDSEQQLRDAQATARSYTPEQNKQARAAGFRNADEMVLFLKAHQSGNKTVVPGVGSVSDGLSLADLFPWHPANTLNMATEALRKATDK